MDAKIINQQKNPFLQREEIVFEIKSESTPSFEEIKKTVGKDENLVVVKKVNSNFGTQIFTAEVFVYDSPEARKKIETIPQKIKKKLAEEEKAKAEAEAKAAAEPAETPTAEEKPAEEPKAEEPKESEQPVEEKKEEAPKEEAKPEEVEKS